MTTVELAAELDVDAQTIGGHLAELGRASLLSTRKDGHRRLLALRRGALDELAECCAAQTDTEHSEVLPDVPDSVSQFFSGSRLSSFPARQSKKVEVLRALVRDFEPGIYCFEAEVNQILLRRYADFATLRRALIDEGMMWRSGGIYRRAI